MNSLEVILMGNPLLRERSVDVDVDTITSSDFQHKLDRLIETMRQENGAGIAAPQVGVLERYFTIEINNNPRYPDKTAFPLLVAINPAIEPIGEEMVDSWEGCLSIPKIRGKLRRHASIIITALDRAGERYTKILEGFPAIVAQHELDHLNGMLFIDRMTDMTSLTFYSEYLKYSALPPMVDTSTDQ